MSSNGMERVNFCWKGITATVKTGSWGQKSGKKIILDNVSGEVKQGELMAVMGPSAAGKSTLFNALTYRYLGGLEISGRRYANGMEIKDRPSMSSVVGYLPQFDLYIGTLTVREHLEFLAKLKIGSLPKEERDERIQGLLSQLGLKKCENTLIGAVGGQKGISGGEKRRLAFASEVLSDPPLLLCDEPTSGLDSWMAENLISYMRQLTNQGKTIMCVIHQPSSALYHMFDHVLLLVQGRTAFMGDVKGANNFFESVGYPCPDTFNPADHYIHKLSMIPKHELEYQGRVDAICDSFQESDYEKHVLHEVDEQILNGPVSGSPVKLKAYKAPFLGQFFALLVRAWKATIKDSFIQWVKFYQYVGVGLAVGFLYLDQEYNQVGVSNINGALFFLCIMNIINPYNSALAVFSQQIPVLMRENNVGLYRVDAFFLAVNLVELPFDLISSSLIIILMYFMIGFNEGIITFFYMLIINAGMVQSGIALAMVVAATSPNADVALAIGPAVSIPLYCLAGYYLNIDSMADYVSWSRFLSPYFYANEGLFIAQWKDLDDIQCDPGEECQFQTGNQILDFYQYNDSFWLDAGVLFLMAVGFRLVALFALAWKAKRQS